MGQKRDKNALTRMEYKSYIQSEKWRRKRSQYFSSKMYKTYPTGKKAGKFVCYGCGADGSLQLHHRTYKRLGCERINVDLIPLCRECHVKTHENHKRSNNGNLWRATKRVARKINRRINDEKKGKCRRRIKELQVHQTWPFREKKA